MILFYLILKAIFKAGQICFCGLIFLLTLASCTPSDMTPNIEDSKQESSDSIPTQKPDSVNVPQDSIPEDSTTEDNIILNDEDGYAISFSDIDVDKSYWESLSKPDGMTIRKPIMDSEEWFQAEPAYTCLGFTISQYSCEMFGVYILPSWNSTFSGKIRLAYLDNEGNVIGHTGSKPISGNKERTLAFFDYITLNPQRIRIIPVVQPDGEKDWICPISSGYYNTWYITAMEEHEIKEWPDEDWGFTINPSSDKLLLRDMHNSSMNEGSYIYTTGNQIRKGETFTLHYTLANPSKKAQKGALKLKDEHGFLEQFNCYRLCQKIRLYSDRELQEWSNTIGTKEIEIPAGSEGWVGTIEGTLTYANYVSYLSACQHLYFKPEGSQEEYFIGPDWRPVMYNLERGISINWGTNFTYMCVK